MTTEQNKALARRVLEAIGANDQARLKELLAPDFVAHQPGGPQNGQAFVQHLSSFRLAFSDSEFTVEEQIAEGDRIATRATWQAIHSGDFQGLPPTGKQIAISAIFFGRIREGKFVENRSLFDQMSLMQQLGLIPPIG
ncbi:MAG TPA: ester cyclase [Promineifilum sp.]